MHTSLTEKDSKRGSQNRGLDALRRHFTQKIASLILKFGSLSDGDFTRQPITWNNKSKSTSLTDVHLYPATLFAYVQCDIEASLKLRLISVIFLLIFRNTLITRNDIKNVMKNFSEEQGLLSRPRKMSISSFTLQEGTLITSLLFF